MFAPSILVSNHLALILLFKQKSVILHEIHTTYIMKKKFYLSLALAAVFTLGGFAQSIEITPTIGYTFGGKVYTRYGELKVKSSESYGGIVGIVLPTDMSVQFEYFRQPTVGEYRDYFNPIEYNQNANLDIDWYQLGFMKHVPVSSQVSPFGGISLGATNFILDSKPTSYNEWSFSVGLQGGVKLYLHDRIGLRLHARLLMPLQWGGFGFYAGSGGSGVSASAGTYFVQADVGAGLIIRLGN